MQQRTKLYRWLVSLTFLLIVFIPSSLYLASPIIAKNLLNHWLQQQGFSVTAFEMRYPRWDSIHIDKVHLQKDTPYQQLDVTSEDVLIHFNPVKLYLHQKIDDVILPITTVTITYFKEEEKNASSEVIKLDTLLPSQWVNKIPTDRLTVEQFRLALNYPLQTSNLLANGSFHFDRDSFVSQFDLIRNELLLGRGKITFDADNQLSLLFLDKGNPLFALKGAFTADKENLYLNASKQINVKHLQHWYSSLNKKGSSAIKLESLPPVNGTIYSEGTTSLPLLTVPQALISSISTQQQVKGNLALIKPTKGFKSATVSLEGSFELSHNQLSASLNPKSNMVLNGLEVARLKKAIKKVELKLKDKIKFNINIAKSLLQQRLDLEVEDAAFAINTTEINLPQLFIQPAYLNFGIKTIDFNKMNFAGTIETRSLNLTLNNKEKFLLNLKSNFTLNELLLSNNFKLKAIGLPLELKGKTTTQLPTANTLFNWQSKPLALSEIDKKMGHILSIPPQLSLISGTLFHNAQGEWKNKQLTIKANNSVRQGALSWDDSLIEQIEFDSQTQLYSTGKLVDTGKIKLGKVTTGIEIKNVSSSYSYNQAPNKSSVTLKTVQAEILGGIVKAKDIQFDPQKPNIKTLIDIEGLDVEEVLKLEQQQGLSGEGKLSGILPLNFKDGELTVNKGNLESLAPGGKIIFIPNPSVAAYAAANIGLKTAIDALGNFHYEQLDIQLDYLTDGTALLKTRLKGSNPDWNKGHPIDFTINIEENVLQLLKTLQFTDKLTKTVEKRYR